MYVLFGQKIKFYTKQKKHIEFEQIKQEKLTANLDTIINNVNHLTNFLYSGKTWIDIKDMYLLTYLSADQFFIDNLI